MKKLLALLKFCWHDWQTEHIRDSSGLTFTLKTCRKCGKEKA